MIAFMFFFQQLNITILRTCAATSKSLYFSLSKVQSIVAFVFINLILFFTLSFHVPVLHLPSDCFLFIISVKTLLTSPFAHYTCHSNHWSFASCVLCENIGIPILILNIRTALYHTIFAYYHCTPVQEFF